MSPLISVIVPVFDVEAYLPACLRSIMCQSFRDIEVIAVDGNSKDHSLDILNRRAEADPRLQVVPHTEKIGPGIARNVGIECAKGDYLWFVDADDLIAPDCLCGIVRRIEDLRPDVLLIGFESFYPDGRREPGPGLRRLQQAPQACFTLVQEPWIADLTMASWGKLIRREFLISMDAEFLVEAPHEDVPLSCRVLLEAEKIGAHPEIGYYYRKSRPGSLMAETAERHFNIFHAYGIVLEEVGEHVRAQDGRVDSNVRKIFFERAIWHYSTILDGDFSGKGALSRGLIPRSLRRKFFRLMHRDYVRYRPPGYRPRRGLRGLKYRLIEHDAYWLYSLMSPANSVRLRVTTAISGRGKSMAASGPTRT